MGDATRAPVAAVPVLEVEPPHPDRAKGREKDNEIITAKYQLLMRDS
jgi:hypothetical protein